MKKQFDLEYYLAHPDVKVVTRDGRDVRICSTELRCKDYPILATFIDTNGNEDEIETFTTYGKALIDQYNEFNDDLFFDLPGPVKKKVPLTKEDLMERVKANKTMWISCDTDMYAKLIIGFNSNFISTVCGIGTNPNIAKFNYTESMCYNFVDGDPCWKEVEE